MQREVIQLKYHLNQIHAYIYIYIGTFCKSFPGITCGSLRWLLIAEGMALRLEIPF